HRGRPGQGTPRQQARGVRPPDLRTLLTQPGCGGLRPRALVLLGLREVVELAALDPGDERSPLARIEDQRRPVRVFAVAYGHDAGKVVSHFDAVVAASAQAALPPYGVRQVSHESAAP